MHAKPLILPETILLHYTKHIFKININILSESEEERRQEKHLGRGRKRLKLKDLIQNLDNKTHIKNAQNH